MTNLFRQARQLLDKKDNGDELTEEELGVVNIGIFACHLLPELDPKYNDIPISQGLEDLAKIFDDAGRVLVPRPVP